MKTENWKVEDLSKEAKRSIGGFIIAFNASIFLTGIAIAVSVLT